MAQGTERDSSRAVSTEAGAEDSARERILRGGADAFVRLGYGGASVEAILEASGVSRRTFYKKFRSKEDVLATLYERSVQRLVGAVEQAYADMPDHRAAMPRAVEAYVRVQAESGALGRLFIQEQFAPGSILAQRKQQAIELFKASLSDGALRTTGRKPDAILVAGVAAAIDRICIETSAQYPDGQWDTSRATAAILRVLSALR